jgi:hypothetical protein
MNGCYPPPNGVDDDDEQIKYGKKLHSRCPTRIPSNTMFLLFLQALINNLLWFFFKIREMVLL